MILDFETKKAHIAFEKSILPLTKSINANFNYFIDNYEAVVILDQKPMFFIFLNYIPFKQHTTLATFEESVSNIQGTPRISKGEWVVEIVFKCEPNDAETILRKLKKTDFETEHIIDYIKSELSNF